MDVVVNKISSENYSYEKERLISALSSAKFVALDCEMTGLGFRNIQTSLDERYKTMQHAVTERALLSLGIVCFESSKQDGSRLKMNVQAFDVLLKCRGRFTSESSALEYLSCHGFDFNRQVKHGLEYFKGDQKEDEGIYDKFPGREIFAHILRAKKPVVVHNGLFDLMFLHNCLYAKLPESIGGLVANLSEMFPEGIYDTKYMSEKKLSSNQTMLAALFRACSTDPIKGKLIETTFPVPDQWSETITTPEAQPWTGGQSDLQKCFEQLDEKQNSVLCHEFMSGLCQDDEFCMRSHRPDKKSRYVRGGKKSASRFLQEKSQNRGTGSTQERGRTGETGSTTNPRMTPAMSNAAVDAFMTGYVFARLAIIGDDGHLNREASTEHLRGSLNRVILRVNDKLIYIPITKSKFCAATDGHRKQSVLVQQLL